MGKKITQYSNFVSINPDNNSLMDISEKTGTSIYESRKWTLTAFKAWVNSWVVASSIAWADITGKPTTIAGYGITDAIDGSGTANYVPKFSNSNTLTDSQIRDNGTSVGLNVAPSSIVQFKVNSGLDYAIQGTTTKSTGSPNGVLGTATGASDSSYGVVGQSSNANILSVGVYGWGNSNATNYGLQGSANGGTLNVGAIGSSTGGVGINVGLYGEALNGSTNYSAKLVDGTQGVGKVLKCVTANGEANWVNFPTEIQLAVSDETTALTTGTGKITFRMPYAMTVTEVRASLVTAQTSGSIFTVDINENGTSIISTKITIDNTEKTSTTATTPAVISDSSLADDAEITVDIDQIGDGTAKGLKILIKGYRAI